MKKISMLCLIFVPLFISCAFAQTSVKAEVDKTSITTDEVITYKLVITSPEKNVSELQLPEFTGFSLISSAQSSMVSVTGGQTKTILVYAFILSPAAEGDFKIGPSTVKINNETISTDSFEIKIKRAIPRPGTGPQDNKPLIPEYPSEETEESLRITL